MSANVFERKSHLIINDVTCVSNYTALHKVEKELKKLVSGKLTIYNEQKLKVSPEKL